MALQENMLKLELGSRRLEFLLLGGNLKIFKTLEDLVSGDVGGGASLVM